MTHVYLRHENAAGSGDGIELYPGKSYFLPNEAPNTQIVDVVEELDANHSVTKLGIYERDVLASVYDPGGIEVLEGGGGGRYKIPVSIDGQRQIFMVLRRDDQILTQSGRWSLVWRTGESQMSAPAQAIQSVGVRSFDASLEIEDSQSQEEVSSVPQEAAGNFVIAREDTDYGPPALASVLMPPPPLPRVDIVLDIPEEDSGEGMASEVGEEEYERDDQVKETVAVTSNARPLSQGTREALSELSTNSVIMLGANASGSSAPHVLLGAPIRDGNGNLQYPEGATSDLQEAIDDINGRRIFKTAMLNKEEQVVSSPGNMDEENLSNTSKYNEGVGKVGQIEMEAIIAVNSHVSSSIDTFHTSRVVAVQEQSLQTRVDLQPVADADLDHQDKSSSSRDSRTRVVESVRATNSERAYILPEDFEITQTKVQIMTLPIGASPSSSTSTGKRKATSSPRKEIRPSKRSKVTFDESHSDQENENEQSITVEAVPRRKKTTPLKGEPSPSPRRTARTPKPSMKSLLPTSTLKQDGRKSRDIVKSSTPSRSRSTSAASSTRFEMYLGSPPRVLFASSTTVDRKQPTMKDFTKMGGEVVTKIDQANILIVGGEELKKTAKLIIAVARGIDVVNERWIVESRRNEFLLDIIPFVPEDDVHETEWSFKLVDAIARGKEGVVQELLHDTTVYTTKDLEKFPAARDLPSIVKVLGGNIVKSSLPYGKTRTKNVLILGTQDDPQAVEVERLGYKLYDKDVIILGALRGQIESESLEFQISVRVKEEEVD